MNAAFIENELQALRNASLYRRLRSVAGEQDAVLTVDGRQVLNFSSNNYLGLANHPAAARSGQGGDRSLRLWFRRVAANFREHDPARRAGAQDRGAERDGSRAGIQFRLPGKHGDHSCFGRRRRCDFERWSQSRQHHRRLSSRARKDLCIPPLRYE